MDKEGRPIAQMTKRMSCATFRTHGNRQVVVYPPQQTKSSRMKPRGGPIDGRRDRGAIQSRQVRGSSKHASGDSKGPLQSRFVSDWQFIKAIRLGACFVDYMCLRVCGRARIMQMIDNAPRVRSLGRGGWIRHSSTIVCGGDERHSDQSIC